MSLPLTEQESILEVQDLRSIPYIDLTMTVMERFGVTVSHDDEYRTFRIPGGQEYHATEMEIEGDWSGGAFLLVAAALAGDLTVRGLDPDSMQADKKILEALERAGVPVEVTPEYIRIAQHPVRPFTFDITHCPDLAPPLVCLAANAEGITVLRGAGRLFGKESNRAVTLQEEAGKVGVRIDLEGDEMIIHGGAIHGGNTEAHQDHRIAMAAAVMALRADGPVTIHGAECVSKSYPDFFDDLKRLGGRVKEER
jgi:3-phosphoshikimate 1-carboxyvinyltransferase